MLPALHSPAITSTWRPSTDKDGFLQVSDVVNKPEAGKTLCEKWGKGRMGRKDDEWMDGWKDGTWNNIR